MAAPKTSAAGLTTPYIATIAKYLPTMADNITNGPQLLSYAKKHKLIRTEELIGHEEQVKIDRETNTNGQWFDGADPMTIRPSSGLVDSYVGHYNYRSGFYLSDTEVMENKGEAAKVNLLDLKMKTCEREMKSDLSECLAGTNYGYTAIRPHGLRDLMGGSASAAGSYDEYQGIDADTTAYSWWKPYVDTQTTLGPNHSNMRSQNLKIFLELQKVFAKPKVGICDQLYYEYYAKAQGGGAETAGYPVVRIVNAEDRAQGTLDLAGPPGLAFHGVPILFDGDVAIPGTTYTAGTDCHINWIDTDFFHFVVDSRWNFKLYKPRERAGNDEQFVDMWQIVFRLTTRCYKRQAMGLGIINL